jgi:hypothetical protein
LIDLDPHLDVLFFPSLSGYFYGLTASVYLQVFLEEIGASVDNVGCFHYYNIERDSAGTILI